MNRSLFRTLNLTALAAVVALTLSTVPAMAAEPQVNDLTSQFRTAGLGDVAGLQVMEVGGIVVIRGRTIDKATADVAGRIATSLGYTRVANLVQVVQPIDDAAIARVAERELTKHRSLDGCNFRVGSKGGVVTVGGTVKYELQKDVAIGLLRTIDGVRSVQSSLVR
jgi:osmotically-inducible protein OsmY